jgi:TP901 family phage tail tape measure protein
MGESVNVGGISGNFQFDLTPGLVNVRKMGTEVEKAANKVKKAETTTKKSSQSMGKTLSSDFTKASHSISKASNQIEGSIKRSSLAASFLKRELTGLKTIGGFMFGPGMVTLGAIGSVGTGLGIASGIQQGFVGVQRTTGLRGAYFKELRKEILSLSAELKGVDISGYQRVAQIGGLLGIKGTENIRNFTEVVIKSSMAMDMAEDSAANYLARITQNMNRPLAEMENLANAANHLGNNTKATAPEILEITQRMSQMSNLVGLTVAETVALATTTRDMGTLLEVGGSAWNNVLQRMISNVEGFADAAGMPLKKFEQLVREKPMEAIKQFSIGMSKLDKFKRIEALDALQIDGIRVAPVIAGLANNVDRLNEILKLSNDEYANGSSVQREYEASASTLSASLSRLWNATKLVADSTFGATLGGLSKIVDRIADSTISLAGYGQTMGKVAIDAKKLADEADHLRESIDALTSKQERSKTQQERLNYLADRLLEIYPDLKIEYDELGNAVGIAADSFERLARAQERAAMQAQKKQIKTLSEEIADREKEINRLESLIPRQEKELTSARNERGSKDTVEIFEKRIRENRVRLRDAKRDLASLVDEKKEAEEYLTYIETGEPTSRMKATKIEQENKTKAGGVSDSGEVDRGLTDEEELRRKLSLMKIANALERQKTSLLREQKELKEKFPNLSNDIEAAFSVEIAAIDQKIAEERARVAEQSTKAIANAEEFLRRLREETATENIEIQKRKIEIDHDVALAKAESVDDEIRAEENYFYALQDIVERERSLKVQAINEEERKDIEAINAQKQIALKGADDKTQVEEEFQRKITAIAAEYETKRRHLQTSSDQEILTLANDLESKITDTKRREAEERERIEEKATRTFERELRERERSYRRILDPLFNGGSIKDVLKNALKEDLADFLALNLASGLRFPIPLADQKGGIFQKALESISQNTNKTAKATEKTEKGVGNLPINLGSIMGGLLVSMNSGGVTGGSIARTFLGSLIGGVVQGVSGKYSEITSPNKSVTPEVQLPPIPKIQDVKLAPGGGSIYTAPLSSSEPVVSISIDNRGGHLDHAAVMSLKQVIKGTVQSELAQVSRTGKKYQ